MSDIAIRVENLSKLYHIGRAQQRHDTLRDAISDFRLRISDSLRSANPAAWDARNPQSAIPKILSRITGPTSGRAEIHGRIASLLESLS